METSALLHWFAIAKPAMSSSLTLCWVKGHESVLEAISPCLQPVQFLL